MKNLYDELGVPKTATQEEIKQAYRDRAKESHPDHGGDPEEFKTLAKTYAILSDSRRRARYDKGENPDKISEAANPNDEAGMIISKLYLDAIECSDVDHSDILEAIRGFLDHEVREHLQKAANALKRVTKYERAIKRTQKQDGINLLTRVAEHHIQMIREEAAEHERQADLRVRAKNMLKDYQYQHDKQPIPEIAPGKIATWGSQHFKFTT